jgi:5-methylthioadenosine/S-adenosylhomocysteine deaminase
MGLAPTLAGEPLGRHPQALEPGDLRLAASLAAREMLGGGTTCVLNHALSADGAVLDAGIEPMAALGLRQVVGIDFAGGPAAPQGEASAQAVVARWHGARDGLVRLAVDVATDAVAVASGQVCEAQMLEAYGFAQRHGLRLTTRTAAPGATAQARQQARRQTGRSSITHLMELGLLDGSWLLSGADHLDETDVALMRESGCHAVCTPMADAVRGVGRGIWTSLQRAGVYCTLGTDGPALTCCADMVEQMKALVLVQNTVRLDAASMSAEIALEMATINAARALGLDAEIGSLEPGKQADVAVFDMRGPHFQVAHKPVSNFVSCGRGADAHLVLVGGRAVWRGPADAASGIQADAMAGARGRIAAILARAAQEN